MNRWLYPFEREARRRQRRRLLIGILLAFLITLLLDRWFYTQFAADFVSNKDRLERLERRDWYRTLRVAGTLYPWAILCSAIALQALASRRPSFTPGRPGTRTPDAMLLIFLSAALSGLVAEILQTVVGRYRPNNLAAQGHHAFKGLIERFQDSGSLGFPSSHAAVAFGAAFAVSFFYPRAGLLALLVAFGCAATRVISGAHFLSDAFAALVVGYACARLLIPRPQSRSLYLP